MKIGINKIPPEGLALEEEITTSSLDLETEMIKCRRPVRIKAQVFRITNTVTVEAHLSASMYSSCSRCLNEFEIDLQKDLKLSYPVDKLDTVIDLNPDIRDQIILDYPIKPLCSQDCKGLCPKCGKNLNEGDCSCGIT